MRFLILLLIFLPIEATAQGMNCDQLPVAIQYEVDSFVCNTRGTGGCWWVEKGNLSGPEQNDIVVLVTVEGACFENYDFPVGSCGNFHITYLLAFIDENNGHKAVEPLRIGARGIRLVQSLSITDGKVTAVTKEYDNDPMCCPSETGKAQFLYRDGKMVEVEQ